MQQINYSEAFERAILSTIIYNPESFKEVFGAGLKQEDFHIPFHRILFRTLEHLYENSAIEESIIKEHLGKEFDEQLMLEVMATYPVTNLSFYVQKLQEYTRLRQFKQLAHQILQSMDENKNAEDILHLIHQEVEKTEEGGRELFKISSFGEIQAEDAEFVCKSWLPFPKNTVSMVSAGGGVGKSFLLLQAAMRMVRDEKLKVFMWLSEDPLGLSRSRFEMIATQILETDVLVFEKNLHIVGADAETIHFLEENRGNISVNSKFYQFKRILSAYDVIILDPLIAMFGADENNNAHARMFINLFTRWATKEKKTIIFIHHGTKNSSQSRGASAFVDAVRLVYRVEYIRNEKGDISEDESRYVLLDKDNNGSKKYLGALKVKRQIFPQKRKSMIEIEYD